MQRDFTLMRAMLDVVASQGKPSDIGEFMDLGDWGQVAFELKRLETDGLIESDFVFTSGDSCLGGKVEGFTEEGREFYRLVENAKVWNIVRMTLESADIDVSYPLLKEVCEEIVKRYVTSFIPDI